MEEMKLSWLIGQTISILYATLTITYQSRYPVIHVLVNISVLCNCGIEVQNHFLLESLVACENGNSKLTMYFTVNTAFVNYLDKFPNLTGSLEFLIIKNRTTFEKTLPISLNISKFNSTLLTASSDLKECINSCTNHKEIFDLQERDDNMELTTN